MYREEKEFEIRKKFVRGDRLVDGGVLSFVVKVSCRVYVLSSFVIFLLDFILFEKRVVMCDFKGCLGFFIICRWC